jgi:hypothetical protein
MYIYRIEMVFRNNLFYNNRSLHTGNTGGSMDLEPAH